MSFLSRLFGRFKQPADLPPPKPLPRHLFDPSIFFDEIRGTWIFPNGLSQETVDGINGLMKAFREYGDGKIDTLAYGLATVRAEVGADMQPVREGFAKTDAGARRAVRRLARRRGPRSAVAKYARPAGPYGHIYYGRGYVQLTWLDGYRRSSADAGVDLVANPDAALDPEIGARILWRGLLDGRWNRRGKGLRFYLDKGDIKGARRTVNVQDRAAEIARMHETFLSALEKARWGEYE